MRLASPLAISVLLSLGASSCLSASDKVDMHKQSLATQHETNRSIIGAGRAIAAQDPDKLDPYEAEELDSWGQVSSEIKTLHDRMSAQEKSIKDFVGSLAAPLIAAIPAGPITAGLGSMLGDFLKTSRQEANDAKAGVDRLDAVVRALSDDTKSKLGSIDPAAIQELRKSINDPERFRQQVGAQLTELGVSAADKGKILGLSPEEILALLVAAGGSTAASRKLSKSQPQIDELYDKQAAMEKAQATMIARLGHGPDVEPPGAGQRKPQ